MTDEIGRPGSGPAIDLVGEADFWLGASRVSPSMREVVRAGLHETLEPRIMQVLVALHQANGRVVSRDELIARCWEGRIVGEDAINRAIGRLRRLSEADGGASFVIETIPRIGFRLAAAPAASSPGPKPEVPPDAMRAPRRRAAPALWAALAVIAVAAPGLWLFRDRLPWTPKPSVARVAVLPFDTIGTGKELHAVADVLLNETVSQLSNSQTEVISPAQSKALRGGDTAAIDRVGADMVIDGTVQGDGKDIDVRIHLDDVREHVVLWSGEFHGSADATEALEASASAQTADVLHWTKAGRSGKVRLDASTLAIFIAGREGTVDGTRNSSEGVALSDYRKVVSASPDFSWGHSAVAAAEAEEVMRHPESQSSDALRADALLEAKRALALEPHNGEAWLARELLAPPGDWQRREALLLQGIAADPDFDPIALIEGNLLGAVGRGRDALVWFRRAHDINPLWVTGNGMLAINLALQGNLTESRAILARMALQWPDFAPNWRYRTNFNIGATDDAVAEFADPAAHRGMDQRTVDALSAALKASTAREAAAKTGAAKAVMEAARTGSLGHGTALMFLSMLGDLDGAFAQAQFYKPVPPSAPPYLFLPATAAMRSDPRFMQVAAKLGLVDYWRSTGQWPDFCSEPGLPYDCRAAAKALTPTGAPSP